MLTDAEREVVFKYLHPVLRANAHWVAPEPPDGEPERYLTREQIAGCLMLSRTFVYGPHAFDGLCRQRLDAINELRGLHAAEG